MSETHVKLLLVSLDNTENKSTFCIEVHTLV